MERRKHGLQTTTRWYFIELYIPTSMSGLDKTPFGGHPTGCSLSRIGAERPTRLFRRTLLGCTVHAALPRERQ
jgi:hypothetical protein